MTIRLRIIATIILFSLLSACATQPYTPIETSEVVLVPGQSKAELYNKIRQWFSQYFVSGKSVVDYQDPKAGTIIGNGISSNGTDFTHLIKYEFKFNIRIDVKDGKFRAQTKILSHSNTDSTSTYTVGAVSQGRSASAEAKVKKIVGDIKAYVMKTNHQSSW